MHIRKAVESDLPRQMEIYSRAREFMKSTGNPNQWGATNWPPEEIIREDIRKGNSYVCEEDGRVIGTFYYIYGEDVDPSYRQIEGGEWLQGGPYGVVHRIASDGSKKGIGEFCLNWAFDQCKHLRIDTHADNVVMQKLLGKLGFTHCGTVYVREDSDPRLAFEKLL